jgi:ADP-ribosyl-[dinitrogen reductase] hydrolase
MKGAIIGDIIGSTHEFLHKVTTKDFEFFPIHSTFTDDTVLTVAVYDSLKNNIPYDKAFMKWIEKYPNRGYGGMFWGWITSKEKKPYGSKGNGAGMRVSAIGWLFDTEEDVLREAKKSAEITHDHVEGIESAQAVAMCIYLARNKKSKEDIREYIEGKFKYNLSRPFREVWSNYKYSELAIDTIPYSLQCFLDSNSFEDSIRNAVSLGGDADTLAAITGSISEAYYGLDENLWNQAKRYLPDDMLELLDDPNNKIEKIYLDIDGIFLDTKEYKQMPKLKEFLDTVFEITSGEVYWLSTHTKHGKNDIALYHLEDIDPQILEMAKKIKNTKWNTLKTEGIDLRSSFLWFDDVVFQSEYRVLESYGKENRLIKVENNLDEMIEYLVENTINTSARSHV